MFIVAADREVLESALSKLPQSTPVREVDPYYSTPGAFLEKIFQHQLTLPPLRPQTLTKFARDLVSQQGGVWAELRGAHPDDRLFLEVIYLLIPVHVRSPRRVKGLLNHYATTVRTAQARGIDWVPRAREIAVFTVLQVEFPHLAADLATTPMLLTYLRGAPVPDGAKKLQRLVERYMTKDAGMRTDPAEAAGPLLDGNGSDEAAVREANIVLNSQLRSYLAKVAAQDVGDPRPDLFYMQSAGFQHGIADPEIGYVIDVAADLSPDEVLAALEDQPPAVLTKAAHLLAQQAEVELGPGRAAIVESLCRLLEGLEHPDLREVADLVEPVVRAATMEGDLRDGAIPGALTLGVVTGRTDLVNELVKRYSADEFAAMGLLSRFGHVLANGAGGPAGMIRDLLLQAYENHPAALHESLTTLPLDAAIELWAAAKDPIDSMLAEMAQNDALASTRTASRGGTPEPTLTGAAERFGDLLSAVEARTDNAEVLISGVLMMGQLHTEELIRKAVLEREDDAIERITLPTLLTQHALVAMAKAPIQHCRWWSKYVTASTSDAPLARTAVARLIKALTSASASDAASITTAVVSVVKLLDVEGISTATEAVTAVLASMPWAPDEETKARRTAAHTVARTLYAAGGADSATAPLVADLVEAFDSYYDADTLGQVLGLVGQLGHRVKGGRGVRRSFRILRAGGRLRPGSLGMPPGR